MNRRMCVTSNSRKMILAIISAAAITMPMMRPAPAVPNAMPMLPAPLSSFQRPSPMFMFIPRRMASLTAAG